MINIIRFILLLLLLGLTTAQSASAEKPKIEDSYWQTNGQPINPLSVKILLFTDGLMNGYGLPDEKLSINNKLIKKISAIRTKGKPVVRVVASDGMTTAIGVTKVKEVIMVRPHLVVLAIGINDAMKNNDTDIVHNNLSMIINELQRAGIYTMIVGIQATPDISDYSYMSSFNSIYAKLATQFGAPFAPYILENIVGQPFKFQNNNIFPNADGAEAVADYFVKKYLYKVVMKFNDVMYENQIKRRTQEYQQKKQQSQNSRKHLIKDKD